MENIKKSLEEIHSSVPVPEKCRSFFKKFYIFSGPGVLVSVGYMDPGNWITSIQGGALYGYFLLSVVFFSSIIAMLLQSMCAKLGIVTGMDLAQATKKILVWRFSVPLIWIVSELSIISTEIAEVIGSAIALNLLLHIPLLIGTLLTILNVFLLLILMKFGIRKIELIIFLLICSIFFIFVYGIILSNPSFLKILIAFIPKKDIFTAKVSGNSSAFLISLGIIGATIMPHNLYLHSSIVQSRKFNRENEREVKDAIRYATIDSNIQLSFSFIVNSLLLILSATLFFEKNLDQIFQISQIYNFLKDPNKIGSMAYSAFSTLFAVALLFSGQNSTITGTLTGQIVMEGFMNLRFSIWKRKTITRLITIFPVVICVLFFGENENMMEKMLIYTQVFLSLSLPVSIIPLLYLTSSKEHMGKFVNHRITIVLGWFLVILLIFLNFHFVIETLR